MGIVAMFAAGLGLGFIVPASSKGIVEWFALKQRAMAMGIKQTGVNIGGLLTAITLPMIAITFGWRMGFVTLGVVAIVSGIAAAIIYRDPPKDKSETPAKDASCASVSPPVKKEKESWLSVFKTRDIWLLCAAGIALYVAEMGVMAYFVLYLKTHLLIPVVTAGFLLGAIDVGGFFGKPIAGVISDRLLGGKRKPAFIMMGTISTILTVVFAILPIGSPQWLILVCAVIFGFAAVGWGGLHFTMVSECAGKEHAATVLAASLVILAFANVVGVPLFGHISDMTGTWTWSWIYLVILGVIGMTCLFFVREERRRLAT
jgi:sugar phosphate permease